MQRSWALDYSNKELFNKFTQEIGFFLDDLCVIKDINAAIIMDSSLNVIAKTRYSAALHFLNVNYSDIQKAIDNVTVVLDTKIDSQNIIVISCIKNEDDDYRLLLIEKKLAPSVLAHAKNSKEAYDDYYNLLQERGSLEIAFIFMFLGVGILLLLASIVMAFLYSWRIVKPVSNLIDVSESIMRGNTKARAQEDCSYEELSMLAKTFNQMVGQVHDQKEDLMNMNKKLDERMKFTGSVLAGVSSGVIGIDNNAIYIWNNAAEKLLGKKINFGEHIYNVIPEIKDIISRVHKNNQFVEREMHYKRDREICIFSVKIENIEMNNDECNRFVITFDDLTQMIVAQQKAAWSEVARRVAHEIKNPLTPIQLSAERIKRKYLPQISDETGIFTELVDVIIRQVGDIKRLINDFTFFARLPESKLKKCDIVDVCKQVVFLMQNATNDMRINLIFEGNNAC
jgi:two-component system nitrogen regulation sensor histidine kinase NtrY